jgi:hypothetical protein
MGLQFVDILGSIESLLSKIDHPGVSLGAWIAGGVSGGHVNPIVWRFLGNFPSSILNPICMHR